MWIVAGTVPCSVRPDGTLINGKIRSACRVYNNFGKELARYDKIHLFDADVGDNHGAYRESDEIEHGDKAVVTETPLGIMGLEGDAIGDLKDRAVEIYRDVVMHRILHVCTGN